LKKRKGRGGKGKRSPQSTEPWLEHHGKRREIKKSEACTRQGGDRLEEKRNPASNHLVEEQSGWGYQENGEKRRKGCEGNKEKNRWARPEGRKKRDR